MPQALAVPLPEGIAQGRMLSVRETCAYLGVCRRTLFEMTFRYKPSLRLPSYKIGRHRRYKYDDLHWWIELRKQAV